MSSTIDAAVVREQGVEFVVVVVKRHVFNSMSDRQAAARSFGFHFGARPVVLMSQDGRGIPTYWGRRDLVNFLRGVPVHALPWKRYSVRAA